MTDSGWTSLGAAIGLIGGMVGFGCVGAGIAASGLGHLLVIPGLAVLILTQWFAFTTYRKHPGRPRYPD